MLFLSCFVMLSSTPVCRCLVVTFWEMVNLLTLVRAVLCEFSFSHWNPGSGVVLDCIDS